MSTLSIPKDWQQAVLRVGAGWYPCLVAREARTGCWQVMWQGGICATYEDADNTARPTHGVITR